MGWNKSSLILITDTKALLKKKNYKAAEIAVVLREN